MTTPCSYALCPSPIGELLVAVDDRGKLCRIDLPGERPHALPAETDQAACAPVCEQLGEYFAGARTAFDLELDPRGTPFQLAAWRALLQIPYGQTASYQEQAERIGNPAAVRAIGAANGRNPIPIVIPCHRVIGKDGALTGFGGGLQAKQWLLDHEARVRAAGQA